MGPEDSGHSFDMSNVQFSSDGTRLLAVLDGLGAMTWKFDANKRKWDISNSFADNAESADFSPDGKYVVTTAYQVARVWNVSTGEEVGKPLQHISDTIAGKIKAAAFSPSGKYVITTGSDNHGRVWEWRNGKSVADFSFERPVNA